jgi:hypothetical protein
MVQATEDRERTTTPLPFRLGYSSHRLAGDWPALRAQVHTYLARIAVAPPALLHDVGCLGTGGSCVRSAADDYRS